MEPDERLMDLILPRGISPLQIHANTWGKKNENYYAYSCSNSLGGSSSCYLISKDKTLATVLPKDFRCQPGEQSYQESETHLEYPGTLAKS